MFFFFFLLGGSLLLVHVYLGCVPLHFNEIELHILKKKKKIVVPNVDGGGGFEHCSRFSICGFCFIQRTNFGFSQSAPEVGLRTR
jgi:hypothetical protein